MTRRTRACEAGFTLIELIASIVILGVIGGAAATVQNDLRIEAERVRGWTALHAFGAALHGAAAACPVRSNGAGALNLVGLADGSIDFNSRCWPVGLIAARSSAIARCLQQIAARCGTP